LVPSKNSGQVFVPSLTLRTWISGNLTAVKKAKATKGWLCCLLLMGGDKGNKSPSLPFPHSGYATCGNSFV